MKRLLLICLPIILLFTAGCYSRRHLDRSPKRRPPVREKKVHRNSRNNSDNQLFDTVFHRKPQRYEGSNLSPAERKMLESNDVRFDKDARNVRRQNQNNRSKDWVFGTKNGSYF